MNWPLRRDIAAAIFIYYAYIQSDRVWFSPNPDSVGMADKNTAYQWGESQ